MTLIAAVKYNNMGCIISDLRISQFAQEKQQDIGLKYIAFDSRLMLYMSGKAVYLLPLIQDQLPTILTKLTFDNVDQDEDPLKTIFKNLLHGKVKKDESSIIGIYLNQATNEFKMFRVDFNYEENIWRIKFIPDDAFDWQVIGSGEILMQQNFFPNCHPFSLHEVFKNALAIRKSKEGEEFTYSLKTVSGSIQNIISQRLKLLGKDVYKKLGIRPVTNLSLVNGSSLCILGGNHEIRKYALHKEPEVINYSIEKAPSNRVNLIDHGTSQTVVAYQTDSDFPILSDEDVLFDPEKLEGEEVRYAPFTISQHTFQLNPKDPIKVIRVVKSTEYLSWCGHEFPVRKEIKIQEKHFVHIEAKNIEELWLNVDEVNCNSFWKDVDLFNQVWLDKYVGKGNPFQLN